MPFGWKEVDLCFYVYTLEGGWWCGLKGRFYSSCVSELSYMFVGKVYINHCNPPTSYSKGTLSENTGTAQRQNISDRTLTTA